ncbi:hypothetical protein P5673_032603, partial [Acropora cervicornis]
GSVLGPTLSLKRDINIFYAGSILKQHSCFKYLDFFTNLRLWLHCMGSLQQDECRFSGKAEKQCSANKFKNHLVCTQSMRERIVSLLTSPPTVVYEIMITAVPCRQIHGYFALRSKPYRKALRNSRELHLPGDKQLGASQLSSMLLQRNVTTFPKKFVLAKH